MDVITSDFGLDDCARPIYTSVEALTLNVRSQAVFGIGFENH